MIKNYSNPAAETWYRTMLADPGSFPFFFTYGGGSIMVFPVWRLSERAQRPQTSGKPQKTSEQWMKILP